MRTAISLPDDLFASVKALARKLGLSRSQIVAEALAQYVDRHRINGTSEHLDSIYEEEHAVVDEPLRGAQRRVLSRSIW